ncbi:MAG: tyrosine-type recombinase/integrase [Bacteroidota bacterium]
MQNVSVRLIHRTSKRDGKRMWYALFTDPERVPQRKTVTLRTKNRAVAEQKRAQLEREVALGAFDPWEDRVAHGVPLTRALGEFGRRCERAVASGEWSANHAAALQQTARQFAGALPEGTRTDRVSRRDVRAFVYGYDNANSRWQAYARLKTFFAWCAERGHVRTSPVVQKDRPEAPQRRPPRYLTEDELRRVVEAAAMHAERLQETGAGVDDAAWWPGLFVFAAATGLRVGEVRTLRWQDVGDDRVRVQASRAGGPGPLEGLVDGAPEWPGFVPKWRKARTVPLLPEAARALRAASEGGLYPYSEGHVFGERLPHRLVWPSPHALRGMSHGRARSGMLSASTIAKAWQTARALAGVGDEGHTFHTCRHTFASHALQRGVPVAHLQRALGHRNIQTTMIYAHSNDATAAAAFREAFGDHG